MSIGEWITEWGPKAKEFAERPEHWIDVRRGETRAKYKGDLMYPVELEGWESTICLWYSVEINHRSERWRRLSIVTESWAHASTDYKAAQKAREELSALKSPEGRRIIFEQFDGLAAFFFPFHDGMAVQPVFGEPRLRQGQRDGLVSYRIPVEFNILVPDDNVSGLASISTKDPVGGRGVILDAKGNPIRSPQRNIALEKRAVEEFDAGENKAGNVLDLNRERRRKAKRAAKNAKRKNR